MNKDFFQGYKGEALNILKKFNVRVWGIAEIETSRGLFKGTVLPRAENDDDKHIVIKIATGYNIGIATNTIKTIKEVGFLKANYKIPEQECPFTENLPNVKLIGTGGTIASRLDYRTGAVIPAFSPGELYGAVPELADICNLDTEKVFAVFSENMGPDQYKQLAIAIGKEIEKGVDGIVIGHGTDTMGYTGSALSFFLRNLPVPVVIVGSQRSSDRPSSDGPVNIMNATTLAGYGDLGEVVVVMHGTTSDSYDLIHRAVRVRKMHSARRDTFRTISDIPLGKIQDRDITFFKDDYRRRGNREDFYLDAKIDDRVGILYFYPGMDSDVMEALIDKSYHGFVMIGTGLGHVGKPMYRALERAQEEEIPVVITVQPLFGFTHLRVYETGRHMLARGVIEGQNMLPEAAFSKLCWALGHTKDVDEIRKIMGTNIAGEITQREPYNGFPVLQGGIPEVDRVLKDIS